MPQGEHSAILSTFIKLLFVIKIFVLSFLSGRFTQVLLYNTIIPQLIGLELNLKLILQLYLSWNFRTALSDHFKVVLEPNYTDKKGIQKSKLVPDQTAPLGAF